MGYVTSTEISAFAQESEALSIDGQDLIADAASRLFDNMCEVAEDFFAPRVTPEVAEERTFYGDSTGFLKLPPYKAASIVTVTSTEYTVPTYRESSGMLISTDGTVWRLGEPVVVDAIWGFADTPADVKEAVIALAIHEWRTADPAFASITETGEQVKVRQIPQVATLAAQKYRQKYGERFIFA